MPKRANIWQAVARMQLSLETRRRLITAPVLGLLAFAFSTWVGWELATPQLTKEQEATIFMLRAISSAVKNYVSLFEELPGKLGDLRLVSPGLFERRNRDEILDGWGRPFHTEFDKHSWQVISYGRDSQPGGAGLDADISSQTESASEYWPTFFQFLFYLNPLPVLIIALVASLFAFVLSYVTITAPTFDRLGWARLIAASLFVLLLSLAFAGFLAFVISSSE
jgi:hypothetical protein